MDTSFTQWHQEQADRLAARIPLEPCLDSRIAFHADVIDGVEAVAAEQAKALPYFRVEANWPGGGFAFTLPFSDATAARTWGLMRAEGRPDAVVTAQPRKAPAQVAADKADGYRKYGSFGTCTLCGDRTKGTVCERHSGATL